MTGRSRPPFEVVDHTADVGIVAYGADLRELLENAALGMFSLMADLSTVTPRHRQEVSVQIPMPDPELLLLRWLKELHYLREKDAFIPCQATVGHLSDTGVQGVVMGEPLHEGIVLLHHIKAVTHHLLRIEPDEGGLKVRVIFDV